jgi:hypothetical protein
LPSAKEDVLNIVCDLLRVLIHGNQEGRSPIIRAVLNEADGASNSNCQAEAVFPFYLKHDRITSLKLLEYFAQSLGIIDAKSVEWIVRTVFPIVQNHFHRNYFKLDHRLPPRYFAVSGRKSIHPILAPSICLADAVSYRTNDRNQFPNCFSVITPDATASIVLTTASSGASTTYPFRSRNVSATTQAVRLLPSKNP